MCQETSINLLTSATIVHFKEHYFETFLPFKTLIDLQYIHLCIDTIYFIQNIYISSDSLLKELLRLLVVLYTFIKQSLVSLQFMYEISSPTNP